MDNDRWNHVDELLQSALDMPAVERDAYLRHACGGDQRLEDEVRSLVAAHDRADRFLGAPAIDLAARELAGERSDDGRQAGGDPLIGQTLSHYRIVEKLHARLPPAAHDGDEARAVGVCRAVHVERERQAVLMPVHHIRRHRGLTRGCRDSGDSACRR